MTHNETNRKKELKLQFLCNNLCQENYGLADFKWRNEKERFRRQNL